MEASGQPLRPDIIEDLNYSTTVRLSAEFRDRRWPRDRILSYIENKLDPRGCFDRPDTIRVRQLILRGKSPSGYAVRLEARQGKRAYILLVERPYAVVVSDEIRGAIDHRAMGMPVAGKPYWDPVRDTAYLADLFIAHLLKDAGE